MAIEGFLKTLITEYQIVKNYLRLQSVVFLKINQFNSFIM